MPGIYLYSGVSFELRIFMGFPLGLPGVYSQCGPNLDSWRNLFRSPDDINR